MNNPTIVCVMCNHNYQDYIEESIKSILNQDYPNIILSVVDDNSSDDSPKIIERLAEEDFRIHPIYLKTGVGAAEARNTSLRDCINKGEFFLITDSDDVCKQGKVRTMLKKIMSSPQIGFCYGDYDVITMSTGNIIREFKEPYDLKELQSRCVVHSSAMIRKEALLSVKEIVDGKDSYYDKELHGWRGDGGFIGSCEDYELFLRLSEKWICVHCAMPLTLVRVHDKNQSQIEKVNPVWQSNWNRIQEKIQKRRVSNIH